LLSSRCDHHRDVVAAFSFRPRITKCTISSNPKHLNKNVWDWMFDTLYVRRRSATDLGSASPDCQDAHTLKGELISTQ
jgi:hypothetical protein